MRQSILFVLLLIALKVGYGQQIRFEKGSWEEVQEKAQASDRLIFLDIYTQWCKPCKWMEERVFTDSAVVQYINHNFVSYKVDAEQGVGKLLAHRYRVDRYPTMLFLEASTKEIYNIVGFMDAAAFLREAKIVTDPLTLKRLRVYHRKFQSGVRDKRFMTEYLTMLSTKYKKTDPMVFNEWFKLLRLPDYLDTSTMKLLLTTIPDANTRAYAVALDLYDPRGFKEHPIFRDTALQDQIKRRMHQALDTTIYTTIESGDQPIFERALDFKEQLILKEQDSLPHRFNHEKELIKLKFYHKNKKVIPFANLASKMIKTGILHDYKTKIAIDTIKRDTNLVYQFNFNIDTTLYNDEEAANLLHLGAHGILDLSDDTTQIQKAIAWVNAALTLHQDVHFYPTLAQLQLKAGAPEQAISTLRGAHQKMKKSKEERIFLRNALMDIYNLQRKAQK